MRLMTVLSVTVLVVVGLVIAVVAVIALGNFVPGLGIVSSVSTLVTTTLAPALVVVCLVATALAFLTRFRLPVAGAVVGAVGGAGTVTMIVPVIMIMAATSAAGGSINPFRAIVTGSLTAATPDAHEVFTITPGGQELHAAVYLPAGTATAHPVGDAPVIVYVHGGGWVSGSELNLSSDMRWFADRGYLVVSLEYTLATPTLHTWDIAAPEVGCGIRWAVDHAAGWGGDPGRYVLAGDSGGGQLAVAVGYAAAAGRAASSCGGEVPAPVGVAVQYPAVDVAGAYEHGFRLADVKTLDAHYLGMAYTGGSPSDFPGRYRAVSGDAAITPEAPPTLIISPSRDDLVPPAGVRDFARKAQEAGVAVDLVEMPLANHAYDDLAADSLGNQAHRTITLAWLERTLGSP